MSTTESEPLHVGALTVAREWTRIGVIGFGGPPAHIRLLRDLCVTRRRWLTPEEFEDGVATTNLLPGPASTQLAIFCAWRVRGAVGAVVGGLGFILPGLLAILGLATLFLRGTPPTWILGAAAGAGAVVAAVALHAGLDLVPSSRARMSSTRGRSLRWCVYVILGGASAAMWGVWLVLVLVACGLAEIVARRPHPLLRERSSDTRAAVVALPFVPTSIALSGLGAVAWVGLKVGALSYGGGFVIVPLMQRDAVDTYGWLTDAQFLNAVALGQLTPGPVTHTVAAVGYGAAGLTGAVVASIAAFAPSFAMVLGGARHFSRIRDNPWVQAFFSGAGPAAIGAILGSTVPLALALEHGWQFVVLTVATVWLVARRPGVQPRGGVIAVLLVAAVLGVLVAAAGGPVSA